MFEERSALARQGRPIAVADHAPRFLQLRSRLRTFAANAKSSEDRLASTGNFAAVH